MGGVLSGGVGLVLAALLAVSCARPLDGREAAPPRASLGHAGISPGAPDVPWNKKTREQRMEFMGLTFHPRMKELFQRSSPRAYDKFRCQTCHGEDMEARRFMMPAALRPLAEADPVADGRARDPKATDFMVATVLPVTVELLAGGDPAIAAKLGCGTCHGAD